MSPSLQACWSSPAAVKSFRAWEISAAEMAVAELEEEKALSLSLVALVEELFLVVLEEFDVVVDLGLVSVTVEEVLVD